MSDDQSAQQGQQSNGGVFVPPTLRESHGELVDLILKSESMNDEERQYWIDILPVMTPEQIAQLRTILTNERDQLAAIDAKYAKDAEQAAVPQRDLSEVEKERRERSTERSSREQETESAEAKTEEEILRQVQDL